MSSWEAEGVNYMWFGGRFRRGGTIRSEAHLCLPGQVVFHVTFIKMFNNARTEKTFTLKYYIAVASYWYMFFSFVSCVKKTRINGTTEVVVAMFLYFYFEFI